MNTKKIVIIFGVITVLIVGITVFSVQKELPKNITREEQAKSAVINEKIYVALEGEGKVAVIDSEEKRVLVTIDLSEQSKSLVKYMAHNVQVAPNGKSVWVTANAMQEKAMSVGHTEENTEESADQIIVIDPLTDKIVKRIPIATDSHLAHIIISPNSKKSYATSQEKGLVYTIDTETFVVDKIIDIGKQSGPHGLRLSPDGKKAFIALLDGKALAVLDLETTKVQKYPFESGAVQTAVTPDGRFAFVSLYATKQIGQLEIATGKIDKIDLPAEAKGPVQLYPTSDSRFVYVADQGYYFDQLTSDKVYRIAVKNGVVDQTIIVGTAPHGVVVDSNGKFVYVTNLLSDDISIIDVEKGKETARLPVGDMPNGISIWHRANGGM